MNDELPTEKEAGENLEKAIRDWLAVSYPDDTRIVTGWLLLTDAIPIEGEGQMVNVCSSDNATDVYKLGLLDFARTVLRHKITGGWGEDE